MAGAKPRRFVLFAWPDDKNATIFRNRHPARHLLILTHDPNGIFPGLKAFRPSERPPVKPVFFAFRVMVGIGFFMIASASFGALLWWRGPLFDTRWFCTRGA